jgi:NADH-quinone oxidoreductase subunit G
MSLETAVLLPQLAQVLAAGALCYCAGENENARILVLLGLLSTRAGASQQDVRNADCIVIAGCNPLQDAPMMALTVRQAWRNGAAVYVIGDSVELPCEFSQVTSLDDIPLSAARRPVLVCGMSGNHAAIADALERYENLQPVCLFPESNSCATALLAREHGASSLEEVVTEGYIKGVISVEADIPAHLLEGIPFVAALDWRDTAVVRAAQIVLPTTAWVEMDGTCVNNEGRAQRFNKVMNPGLPIRGLDPEGHPSHRHRTAASGGEALPAWQMVAGLIEMLGGERITEPLSGRWEPLRELAAEGPGVVLNEL